MPCDCRMIVSVGKAEFRTQVIPSTITPRWDFSCEAVVHQLPGNTLDIEVYDEDQSSKDDFLGRTALSIPDLAEKAVSDMVRFTQQSIFFFFFVLANRVESSRSSRATVSS